MTFEPLIREGGLQYKIVLSQTIVGHLVFDDGAWKFSPSGVEKIAGHQLMSIAEALSILNGAALTLTESFPTEGKP